MNRPKTTIEANNELEQYEMYSVEPLCDHDGDGARQHIATIYDHEEAHEILRLWNADEKDLAQMRNTILGATKWIERICDRKEMLPASFMDNTDPAPLVKNLRAILDSLENASADLPPNG